MGRPVAARGPGPSSPGKRRRGNELAGDPVEHVKESALVRLHQDLACASVDLDIGKDAIAERYRSPTNRRALPGNATPVRRCPDSQPGWNIHKGCRSPMPRGFPAMAHRCRCRRKSGWLPDRRTGCPTPNLPRRISTTRPPRFWRPSRVRIFERLRGIAGNRVEAPHFTASVDIESGEESAMRCELGAGKPDDHLVLHDARSHGERVSRRVFREDSRGPEVPVAASSATNLPSRTGTMTLPS